MSAEDKATALVEVQGIQRFAIGARYDESDPTKPFSYAAPQEDGEWVRYADYLEITNRQSPPNSIENLADEALAGFAEFFGKCLQDESFAGLSVQTKFDKLGKPAVYEVAACEMVGTEPMRRVAIKG